MLGQKLRQAATRVYQVLSQEKHAMSDSDDDYDYGAHDHGLDFDSLRLALELSVEQQLRNGYVLDHPADTYVNPTTTLDGDDVSCFIDAEEAEAVAAALRDEARLLREAQDTEYARALAQDQMRERSHQQREAWRKLHRRVQKQRLRALQARVVPEPADHDSRTGELTTSALVLRFPDGRRAERRFRAADRLADVRTYVEALALEEELRRAKASEGGGGESGAETQQRELCADDEVEAIMDEDDDEDTQQQHSRFHLVSSYPRRRLADLGLTLHEAGLCPSGVLFVEPDAEL